MKKHQLFSLLASVILFVISIFIPIHIFYDMNFLIGLLFAIPTAFFIFCSLLKTERFVDIFFSETLSQPQVKGNIVVCVMLVFILTFVNYIILNQRLKNQFIENGIITQAEILGGYSETTTRRMHSTTLNYLQISFKDTISGDLIKGESTINSQLVKNIDGYSTIQVIYLKNNPKVFRILDTEEELEKYGISMRGLNFDDFKVIKDLKTPNEILNYLLDLDSSWLLKKEQGLNVLENSRLNMRLVFDNTNKIYLLADSGLRNFVPEKDVIKKVFVDKKDIGLEEDTDSEKGIKATVKDATYIAETEFYVVAFNIDCYLNGGVSNCEEQLIFERK